jgi:hypothetical protein
MRRINVFAAVVLTAHTAIAPATTLVGIWTKKKITVAADSKQMVSNKSGVRVGSQNACKIYQNGDLIFAFAGLAKAEQVDVVRSIKNAYPLVVQGTDKKPTLDSALVAAQEALGRVIKARGQSSDSNVYAGMIIAGKIDGKLQMIREEIRGVRLEGGVSVAQKSQRIAYPEARGHNGTDPHRGIEVVGAKKAIERSSRHSVDWAKGEDGKVARHLIELETEDPEDSGSVGLPISEVQVTERGIKWISKGECQ